VIRTIKIELGDSVTSSSSVIRAIAEREPWLFIRTVRHYSVGLVSKTLRTFCKF